MREQFDEKEKNTSDAPEAEEEYAYKKVIKDKHYRRTWSVASIILAVLSVLLTYFSYLGLVLGLLSVGCSAISRKNLGYFDKMSLAGMIIAIFGVVFSLAGILLSSILSGML